MTTTPPTPDLGPDEPTVDPFQGAPTPDVDPNDQRHQEPKQ